MMNDNGMIKFDAEKTPGETGSEEKIILEPEAADDGPRLTFPCEMPMKIIGENSPEMVADVLKAFRDQGVAVDEADLKMVPSREGTYCSVNYTFTAQSRDQVDALYIALTSNPRIKWVI